MLDLSSADTVGEVNFQGHMCPGKCEAKGWRMFWEAAMELPAPIPFTQTPELLPGEKFTGWRLHTKPKRSVRHRQSYYFDGHFKGYVQPSENGFRFVIKTNNVVGVMPVLNKAKLLVEKSATW